MPLFVLIWVACTGADDPGPAPDPLPDACEPTASTATASGTDSGQTTDSGGPTDSADTGDAPPWLLDCAVLDVPELVTSRQLRLTLSEPGAVRLCCTHQSDPAQAHVVWSPQGTEHLLTLEGLLASANYECDDDVTLATGEQRVSATLSTDALPDWIRLPELTGDPALSEGGYTLVNHFLNGKAVDEQKLLIFDREGRIRWYHTVRDDITAVDATYVGDGNVLYGGGFGGPPTLVDMALHQVFQGAQPTIGVSHHHDVEMLPSGRIAGLVTTRNQGDGAEFTGFGVEIIDVPSGELVWSYDSQIAIDAGELTEGSNDPWHANALQVIEENGVLQDVYVNLRDLNHLVRIDPESKRITSVLGPGGDFALVDGRGDPAPSDQWFDFPHAPEVRGDRVLFYDNRNNAPASDTSRAVELTLDRGAATAQVSWEWTERDFREQAWGDVDTLSTGDVLVTIAHCDHCQISDDASRSAVVEVDRDSTEVLWRLTWPEAADGIYRADRIPGCEVFANAAYCPDVLDR